MRGTNGNCTVPATAVGVVMNVTAVGPTAPSYLSVFPPDAPKPLVSSLNYAPGNGPTPNAVTVGLSVDGSVGFFNAFGTVDVIADVVGYYDPAELRLRDSPVRRATRATPGHPGRREPPVATGPQGPVGPLPTVRLATTSGLSRSSDTAVGEANAKQVFLKSTGGAGTFLVQLDGQFNNFGALWFDYHCKLQRLTYPYVVGPGGPPWVDIAGTRRDASWRIGRDNAGNSTTARGVPLSIQTTVAASGPFASVDVRLVCWGTIDPAGPLYDYGLGLESATMTLLPVGGTA